jgi:hypothetical protein
MAAVTLTFKISQKLFKKKKRSTRVKIISCHSFAWQLKHGNEHKGKIQKERKKKELSEYSETCEQHIASGPKKKQCYLQGCAITT